MTWRSTLKWIMDMCGKYRAVMNLKSWWQVYMNFNSYPAYQSEFSKESLQNMQCPCTVMAGWKYLFVTFIHPLGGEMHNMAHIRRSKTSYSSTDSFLLPCRSQRLTEFKSSALTHIFNQRSPHWPLNLILGLCDDHITRILHVHCSVSYIMFEIACCK